MGTLTLAGYGYTMRHGMKVQIVTLFGVSHLQHYIVTEDGNITSVYPPLVFIHVIMSVALALQMYSHTRIRKRTILPKVAGFSPQNYTVCFKETNHNGSHVYKPVQYASDIVLHAFFSVIHWRL
jgi:hypothetical protein